MLSLAGQTTIVAEINSEITAINTAIFHHSKWLAEWNRKFVCRHLLSDNFLHSDSYKNCGFGQWYYGEHASRTREIDEFHQLELLHKKLHNSVSLIVDNANKNELIESDDYEELIACEMAFTVKLVALRDRLFTQLYSFDYLTGVYDRQAFDSILEKEFSRIQRSDSYSSIVMVDIDYFKKVNDQYGHLAGDKVLKFFAHYLKENIRPYDSVGRYGGEEFLIFLPDASLTDAHVIMERLRKELSNQPIEITNEGTATLNITASFGISLMSKNHPPSQAIENADIAMYEAKSNGRNKVTLYKY